MVNMCAREPILMVVPEYYLSNHFNFCNDRERTQLAVNLTVPNHRLTMVKWAIGFKEKSF